MNILKQLKNSISVIGSSNYDILLKVNEIPVAGETVLATGMETGFGGKGANQRLYSGIFIHFQVI